MIKTFTRVAVFVSMICLLQSVTMAAERVALVIGNSSYQHSSRLVNPANDAASIAQALTRLGFDVRTELDLSYDQLRRALRDFSGRAAGAQFAVVYYAGHGIEVNKHNYIIPVDAQLKSDRDIDYEAVPLDRVIDAVDGAETLKLVLVDACRNNPFVSTMELTSGKRSIGRGLARVEPDVGTLVSFAAREGTTAEDGDGSNSPYAAALLKHLEEPGLEVQFLFRKVRDSVMQATNRRQQPFTYGSLPGREIFLAGPQLAGKTQSDAPASVAPVDVVNKLRQGMKFEAARKLLIDGGWQATMYAWQDIEGRCGFREEICQKYQETVACSPVGLAQCRFNYTDAGGSRLTVTTIGEELEFLELLNWSVEKVN